MRSGARQKVEMLRDKSGQSVSDAAGRGRSGTRRTRPFNVADARRRSSDKALTPHHDKERAMRTSWRKGRQLVRICHGNQARHDGRRRTSWPFILVAGQLRLRADIDSSPNVWLKKKKENGDMVGSGHELAQMAGRLSCSVDRRVLPTPHRFLVIE